MNRNPHYLQSSLALLTRLLEILLPSYILVLTNRLRTLLLFHLRLLTLRTLSKILIHRPWHLDPLLLERSLNLRKNSDQRRKLLYR